MRSLDRVALSSFIQSELEKFYRERLDSLNKLDFKAVLRRKNPYLFRAKGVQTASDLARDILEAYLSSSEEERFGGFLESIALFVAEQVHNAYESTLEGIDLEFDYNGAHYFVQVKSGTNWGNSSQKKRLAQDFENAARSYRAVYPQAKVICVEGSCYGRVRARKSAQSHIVLAGQAFWELLSGSPELYLEIIEPLGSAAQTFSLEFKNRRKGIEEEFAAKIAESFATLDGRIDWQQLLSFVSSAG
ncbi:MAG: PmeII family type II restriction endonuclease [Aggregatilineales bacterium]